MKHNILAGLIALSCMDAIAQDQGSSRARYRYTFTEPAEWMAMQVALATANISRKSSGLGFNGDPLDIAVIEEVQADETYENDVSMVSNRILDEMCLGFFARRYEGAGGALAMAAERVRAEEERENAIKDRYIAYIATLTPEDARKVEELTARLAPTMVDTKIDWERYAREDAALFIREQSMSCNQR